MEDLRSVMLRRLGDEPSLMCSVQPKSGDIVVSVNDQRIGWLVISSHGFFAINLDAEGDRGYQSVLLDALSDALVYIAERA